MPLAFLCCVGAGPRSLQVLLAVDTVLGGRTYYVSSVSGKVPVRSEVHLRNVFWSRIGAVRVADVDPCCLLPVAVWPHFRLRGRAVRLQSGAALQFSMTQGPVVADDIYLGETYDARLEQPGWSTCGTSPAFLCLPLARCRVASCTRLASTRRASLPAARSMCVHVLWLCPRVSYQRSRTARRGLPQWLHRCSQRRCCRGTAFPSPSMLRTRRCQSSSQWLASMSLTLGRTWRVKPRPASSAPMVPRRSRTCMASHCTRMALVRLCCCAFTTREMTVRGGTGVCMGAV